MEIGEAVPMIKKNEGFSATPYRCTEGKITIGYGLNLERRALHSGVLPWLAKEMIPAIRKGGIGPNWEGLVMDEGIATQILVADLHYKWEELLEEKSWVSTLCDEAQLVLMDMVYNLGVEGLLGFKRMFAAMLVGDWGKAADEMLDSKWASQVGQRALNNADIIRGLQVDDLSPVQRLRRLESKVGVF